MFNLIYVNWVFSKLDCNNQSQFNFLFWGKLATGLILSR